MAQQMGSISWNLDGQAGNTKLDMEKKAQQVVTRFADLIFAYGAALELLVSESDPVAMLVLSQITKQLLTDATDKLGETAGADMREEILE